jgi:uncharacterized protein (DUF362 family)/Pyruvate/2-oxoacid:ferredoxin oxidoreductase delta subunit
VINKVVINKVEINKMVKSIVAIIKCEDYAPENVEIALKTGVDILGGIEQFYKKSDRIIFKPNLLVKSAPEKCVTTHPQVFEGVIKLFQEKGYINLGYGDSPGNPIGGVEKTADGSGLKSIADKLGVPLKNFSEGNIVEFPEGRVSKSFTICKGVLEADGIVNLCKMKTHQLERITGAVKNTFGCVFGVNKMAFHAKYPDSNSFGKMLVDLNFLVKPKLHIMDGIMAMEGNGPQSGTPISMKVIIISTDPVALDSLFCRLINLDPMLVPTNRYGSEYGLGNIDFENIEIYNESGIITIEQAVELYGDSKFDVYRGTTEDAQIKILKPVLSLLKKRPYIIKKKCISCGICVKSCPIGEKALKFPNKNAGNKVPKYDYNYCIRCYCCQELCPQKAIEVKIPVLTKLIDRNWKL